MGASIFELCGEDRRGAGIKCHFVAHDGRPRTGRYTVREVRPNARKQYLSWFDPTARSVYLDGHPVIAQIFFPFDEAALDSSSDRVVIDALITWYRFELGQRKEVALDFVGHADARGASGYNLGLGLRRAQAARKRVDTGVQANWSDRVRFSKYDTRADSRGATMATGDHAADRRVDVVLPNVTRTEHVEEIEPLLITADYTGPLTKKLLFRSWGGGGAGVGKFGGEVLEIEIKNPKSGVRAFYYYAGAGAGVGLPVSVSRRSEEYTEQVLPYSFVDVDDFAGAGSIQTAMAVGGVQCLYFSGPKLRYTKQVLRKEGVEFCFPGWDLQVGVGASFGSWEKMPYRNERDRTEHIERQYRERQKR